MRIKTTLSKLAGEIRIPASKSHTIRALAIAAPPFGVAVRYAAVYGQGNKLR